MTTPIQNIQKILRKQADAIKNYKPSFTVFRTHFASFSNFYVEAGTTGYKGGDSGHGCRTFFAIGGDMPFKVTLNKHEALDDVNEVGLWLEGDDELRQLINCLREAADVLEEQANGGGAVWCRESYEMECSK